MRQKTVTTKLLQSVAEVYYKVRQVLQSASGITKCDRLLLQRASGITKCDSYYKVRGNNHIKVIRALQYFSLECQKLRIWIKQTFLVRLKNPSKTVATKNQSQTSQKAVDAFLLHLALIQN